MVRDLARNTDRRKTHIIAGVPAARGAKGLDSEDLALFHLGLVLVPHHRDGLVAMDVVALDIVGAEVPHGLDAVRLAADLDLPALHGLLDGGADVANAHIDTGGLSGGG